MTTVLDNRAAALPRGVTDGQRLKQVLLSMLVGLRQMLVGYWLVMVVAFLVVGIVIQLATSGVDHSMWDYGAASPKYFSMAIGITITPAYFALLVAQGVTRRMFSVAAGIYLTGAAAATALVWVAVYQIEHLLYSWQGWSETLSNPHLFTSTSQPGLIFAEYFLLILSHETTGWMLGIIFVRLGAWRGVMLLPLAVIPALVGEFMVVAQWLANILDNTGYHRPPLAVAVPSVLIVSALGVYGGYRILQPVALKPAKG